MPKPHIYVAKSGRETFKVRFRYNGSNCQETFDTRQKAQTFCDDIRNRGVVAALRLLDVKQDDDALTVDVLAEKFFAWKARDPDVRSDRTVADYRRDYRNWIRPTFGTRAASSVDERDIQDWVDAMVAGTLGRPPAAPKSIGDRHMIVHGMYAWAMSPARRLVDFNPCLATHLPKRRRKAAKGLRPAEWQALYAALEAISPDAADLALFLLASGWRFSEATALKAFDVEDDGTTVHVTMGYVVRRNAAGQHVIVEDAKSEAGQRRIKLDADAAEMIRRRVGAVSADGNGLVLTTRRGSRWHYSNFRDRFWNPAVKAANLDRNPTPHWLRHTSVGWLVMTGRVSLPEIQRRIGHESIQTTINVYGRMIDDVPDEALAGFAALRGKVRQIGAAKSDASQGPPSGTPQVSPD